MPNVSVDQIFQQDPEWLKQNYPQYYSQYIEKVGQPGASLGQTQASTAQTQTNTQLSSRQVAQNNLITQTQQQFDSSKDKNGYVSSNLYNQARDKATSLGISTDDFDKQFGTNYVDPNNVINYNTPQGLGLRTQKSTLEGNIDQPVNDLLKKYSNLKMVGSVEGHFATNPLAQALGVGGAERNYENERNTTISSIQSLLAKADFSGFKLNKADLENITNLIPSITDSSDQAKSKIAQLNGLLKEISSNGVPQDVMKSAGLQSGLEKVPQEGGALLTGILGNILNPYINATNSALKSTQQATNNPKNKGNLLQSILSAGQATAGLAGAAASTIPDDAVNAVSLEAPGYLKGKLGDILRPTLESGNAGYKSDLLKNILTLGFKGGQKEAGKAIDATVNAAEEAGQGSINLAKVFKSAQDIANTKSREVSQSMRSIIADETPAMLPKGEGELPISASDALEKRRALQERLNANYFTTGAGNTVAKQNAANILRGELSKEMKAQIPGLEKADTLYHNYSKNFGGNVMSKVTMGGNPGRAIKYAGLYEILGHSLPEPIKKYLPFLFE